MTTLHGTDITVVGSDRAYLRPTRFALEQSDAVTAVSQHLADETHLVFGVKKQLDVVHNFVDTERFKPTNHKPWYQREDDERIIVHASNFRPVKRVADLVRAFALIQKQLPARLLLLGDGPDREHALAVASDLGCKHRVEHLGMRDDLEQVLPKADLFLSASQTESFGLSILEAMSCGVPCVSTDVGGVSEVVGDTGSLVPFSEPEAMATAAIELLSDPKLHSSQSHAARQRAMNSFATDQIVTQYESIYERVLR